MIFYSKYIFFLARCPSSPPGRGSCVPSHREGVQGPHALHRVHPEGSRTLRHGQDHPPTLIQTRVQRRRRHEVHGLQPVHQQNDEQVRGTFKSEYKVSIYGQEKKVRYYGLRGWDWPFWVGFVCMYLTLLLIYKLKRFNLLVFIICFDTFNLVSIESKSNS